MTDCDRLILAGSDAAIDALINEPNVTTTYRSSKLCVLACAHPEPAALWRAETGGWTRMFERSYLAPLLDDVERGRLVAAFFDWLGGRYGQEIEPGRNRACYEFLYGHAQALRGQSACSALLDIGCGPGTILETELPTQVSLIQGYDIGDEVRQAARAAGLQVMTPDQFHGGKGLFSIALSAYVMHYACDMDGTLKAVAQQLMPGGIWALNFHKGINASLFMSRLPGTGLSLVGEPQNSPFGLVLTVGA